MSEKDNFALVTRPPSAVESVVPAVKRIVTLMVTETLALAQARIQTQNPPALQPYASADLESRFQKGECHYYGWGVPKDYEEAARWFRMAAELGDALAQCFLGSCYGSGQGVPQDYAPAVHWFGKAAEQGHATAQYNLGASYANGWGVAQDYDAQAVHWFRKAAEQGHATAQCYLLGEGVPQDDFEAYKWLRLAVEQGYKDTRGALIMAGASSSSQELQEAERWVREFIRSHQRSVQTE